MKGSFGIEISRSQQSVGILRDRQIGSCPEWHEIKGLIAMGCAAQFSEVPISCSSNSPSIFEAEESTGFQVEK